MNGSIVVRIARRGVFVILLASLVFGVVMREMSSSREAIFAYVQVIQNALVLLLVWSVIFARSEPAMTRVGIVFVLISFVLTFWIYKL